jgi:hypothetical protein
MARVKAARDRAGVAFLDIVRAESVRAPLEDGVRIGAATPEAAALGRKHSRQTLPW